MLVSALFFEVIEGLLRIGIPVQVEVHLRIVGLKFGTCFGHEPVEAHAVAVALGMGKMGKHLGEGEPVGRRFPAGIFIGQLGHQAAQNSGHRLEKIQAGKSIFRHDSSYDVLG